MNQDHALSLDQINAIVGAPTENTFGPNDQIPRYSDLTWWTDHTHQQPYVSSSSKGSYLIHLMMKVAHMIIALLVIPREQRSTISTLELKILYAMALLDDNLIPHYGSLLCNKLTCLSTSWSGKIYCGGIVSLFAKSAPVRAPFPGIHQPLPDDPYLTMKTGTSLPSVGLLTSLIDKSRHIFFPSPSPRRKMKKVEKVMRIMRVTGRHHKILLPWVVSAHPIMLDNHHITSNIWINSSRSIPALTLTIKMS
ncbi:unnamed protein product [Lactuca saligna]|uniref:Uncharacterized protein n=1 Tax=Lactuca saligna TaxID=75948 RepID=A0AA36EHJ2_LACSI|nr:unnamed protein product [Lactuca saligna]